MEARQRGSALSESWIWVVILAVITPLAPDYLAPLLVVLAIVFAGLDLRRRRKALEIGPAGRLLLVFILYMTLRLIACHDLALGAATMLMWYVMFGLYLALNAVITSVYRLESLLFCVSLVAGIMGLFAMVQYIANVISPGCIPLQFWSFSDPVFYQLLPFKVTLFSGGMRAAATFQNPNLFAQYAVLVMPFCAYYAFSGERTASKIIARFCLLFLAVGTAFSFSRGAYFAFLVIAVVMCIANLRYIKMLAATVFAGLLLVPDTVFSRFFSVDVSADLAITERFQIWGIAMENIIRSPLFGYGPGIGFIWHALSAEGIAAPHAHNLFLELLLEGGVIAIFLMGLLLWKLLRCGFDLVLHSERTRFFGAAVIAAAAAFCLYGMVDFALLSPRLVGTFCLTLAVSDRASALYLSQDPYSLAEAIPFYQKCRAWIASRRSNASPALPE